MWISYSIGLISMLLFFFVYFFFIKPLVSANIATVTGDNISGKFAI